MLERAGARAIAILVGIALLLALIAFGIHQWQAKLAAKAQARLSTNQAQAVSESAKDAINATGAVSGRQQATDDLTRSNADAIRKAKGADAPVDPAATNAGLAGLCKRRVYSRDPKCLRFTVAR